MGKLLDINWLNQSRLGKAPEYEIGVTFTASTALSCGLHQNKPQSAHRACYWAMWARDPWLFKDIIVKWPGVQGHKLRSRQQFWRSQVPRDRMAGAVLNTWQETDLGKYIVIMVLGLYKLKSIPLKRWGELGRNELSEMLGSWRQKFYLGTSVYWPCS